MKKKVTLDIGEKVGNKAFSPTLKTIDLIGWGFESPVSGTEAGIGSSRRPSASLQKLYVNTEKNVNVNDLLLILQSGRIIPKAVIKTFISGNEQLSLEMEHVVIVGGTRYPKWGWKFTLAVLKLFYNYSPGIVQVVDKYTIDPDEIE